MGSLAYILIAVQFLLLAIFCFFALFKYMYAIASLRKPNFKRVVPSGQKCAVVIVAFNEEYVVEDTITACDALTYQNKVIVLADDSTDPKIREKNRRIAQERGCAKRTNHSFAEQAPKEQGGWEFKSLEIWESEDFILIQRPYNVGFKAGCLRRIHEYLESQGISFIYLLDADWHPQRDALERSFELLEEDDRNAFVQTKRVARQNGLNLFQKFASIMEETCYFVDFEGRQALKHPILFSGCCTLMRLDAIRDVGGFTPGHLTEDLDLSNRFWLRRWKGVYCGSIVNTGEVPFSYNHYIRQQERWSAGTSACLRTYFTKIIASDSLNFIEKLSVLRQNAYFFANIFTLWAFVVGLFTVTWILADWNSYAVEYYLYILGTLQTPLIILAFLCVFAAFVGPLNMILIQKRKPRELVFLPMSVWYAWSLLHTYLIGNLKGLFNVKLEWFRTPKYDRKDVLTLARTPALRRAVHGLTCVVFLSFYFVEGWAFGWIDFFALLWIPAMVLASVE